IDVSPTSLSMTAEEGSSTTATLTVQNVGGATLTVSSITDNQTWLSESPTNFSVNAGSSRAVTVTASAASLTVGTYTATITITSNDPDEATKTVGVTFTVTAEPEIWVNATYLEIEVNQGTQGEAWFEVKNVGGGTLQVTDMHDGSDDIWQSEQAFNLGPNESKWVGVYSGNWMYGGTYDFTITIDSNAGNATIELHVIINPVGGECSEFNWTSVHTDGIDYYGVSSDGWNGWAAGYRGISRTTNGSSWSELGVQDNFADIHVVGSTGFAVSGGSWGKVFRTYNGSDWDQVYAAEGAGCAGVFYDGGSTVWVAAGGGKVLKSTNTGGNWDAIQVGSSNVQLLSVFSEGNGVVWACGTSGSSCLYKSTNWGNSGSWSQVSVTNIGGLEDVWFSNGTGWLAGASGILYSSNGGGSWNQASVPVGGPFRAVQSDGWSSTCVHAVGGNDYSGFIIRSSDGGATWETEYTTSYRLMELVMGDTWGFVVGGNPGPTGGIWKGAATAR
ncbi:hypothetical protein JXA88_15810, partial [Candidatus Fermentibacteria bacterium]|nr:hypothetical protein [Candidatus Fermentibacteria bacterium]